MELPNLYITNMWKLNRYLYFSNQIESDLQNLNDTSSSVLKQSFGIFNLLDAKQKNYTKNYT